MRRAGAGPVPVFSAADIRRHEHDVAVAHASLGDDVVGKCFHFGTASLEHGHFQTTVVVEMNMERCLREIVVIVKVLGQALRQLARGMVIDVAQGRDAFAALRDLQVGLLQTAAGQVADRLRAVGVTARRNEGVEFGDEIVVNGDGQALHGGLRIIRYDDQSLTSYSPIPMFVQGDNRAADACVG
jgi:hypothetical protein